MALASLYLKASIPILFWSNHSSDHSPRNESRLFLSCLLCSRHSVDDYSLFEIASQPIACHFLVSRSDTHRQAVALDLMNGTLAQFHLANRFQSVRKICVLFGITESVNKKNPRNCWAVREMKSLDPVYRASAIHRADRLLMLIILRYALQYFLHSACLYLLNCA